MSHGDHESHQKVIDLVKEYNAQSKDNIISIMLDTKVCASCEHHLALTVDLAGCISKILDIVYI